MTKCGGKRERERERVISAGFELGTARSVDQG